MPKLQLACANSFPSLQVRRQCSTLEYPYTSHTRKAYVKMLCHPFMIVNTISSFPLLFEDKMIDVVVWSYFELFLYLLNQWGKLLYFVHWFALGATGNRTWRRQKEGHPIPPDIRFKVLPGTYNPSYYNWPFPKDQTINRWMDTWSFDVSDSKSLARTLI